MVDNPLHTYSPESLAAAHERRAQALRDEIEDLLATGLQAHAVPVRQRAERHEATAAYLRELVAMRSARTSRS